MIKLVIKFKVELTSRLPLSASEMSNQDAERNIITQEHVNKQMYKEQLSDISKNVYYHLLHHKPSTKLQTLQLFWC